MRPTLLSIVHHYQRASLRPWPSTAKTLYFSLSTVSSLHPPMWSPLLCGEETASKKGKISSSGCIQHRSSFLYTIFRCKIFLGKYFKHTYFMWNKWTLGESCWYMIECQETRCSLAPSILNLFVLLQLLLAIGTKLEHVITQLAHDVAEKHSAIQGDLVVKPSDDHFWFHRPRIVLYLIHFILFQNAFESSFFFWIFVRNL